MKKVMRRILLALLMVFAVVVIAVPMGASADEESRVAVYVQVPAEWEGPCIWAWDEDGNNAFSAWPGGEMETDSANEGWYYIWIPDWATHIIVNANDGGVQTSELILEGADTWITITDAETVDITYDKQTTGDTPAYVEKFVIHAQVDVSWESPYLWAWSAPDGTNAFESWPGKEMKAGEDGWYTVKAPVWINSVIVNANEGAIQTEDISIDPAEVWITVDADGVYDFSYIDPSQAGIPDIMINVVAPTDWEAPCLWAWSAPDGTNVYTSWPGESFEETESGWLTKEIPGWVNSVIVNAGEGSVQTTDISIETGKDVWVIVTGSEVYEVYYEEPDISNLSGSEDSETEEAVSTDNEDQISESEDTVKTEGDTVTDDTSIETITDENADTPASAATEADSSNNTMIIIISAAAGLVIIAAIIIALKKKKAN